MSAVVLKCNASASRTFTPSASIPGQPPKKTLVAEYVTTGEMCLLLWKEMEASSLAKNNAAYRARSASLVVAQVLDIR